MVLQGERAFAVLAVFADGLVAGRAEDFAVVLHEHAVVEDRDVGGLEKLAVFREFRRVEDDVVRLPFALRAADVHERRILAVDGGSLSVRIRRISIIVKDLDFIHALNDDAGVAAALALGRDADGRRPFDMQLAAAEAVLRPQGALLRNGFHVAVDDSPARRRPVAFAPFVHVRPVEQHDGVRRSRNGNECARLHDRRVGAAVVMHMPLRSRNQRRVLIAIAQNGQILLRLR